MNLPAGVQVSNPLHIQWNPPWNPNWINASSVLDYFTNTMNPFYDPNCLNEQIKIQRLSPEVMARATGVEYTLLHANEPLYVVRKQYRQANQTITPLEDYYIIGGTVYQAPDLGSLLNCRLQACLHHIRTAFEETKSYYRFNQSKGYSWQFKNAPPVAKAEGSEKDKGNVMEDARASLYQMHRMDALIDDLVSRFPVPILEDVEEADSEEKNAVKTELKEDAKNKNDEARKPEAKKVKSE